MLHLVTIYSPPGVNAIGSTQVLPLATDVPRGTVHFSDGLDGLTAGKYIAQRGQHDLADTTVWVFHPSTAAFVYVGDLLLRKARCLRKKRLSVEAPVVLRGVEPS